MPELTLGSLFSGSGGFELAGLLNGITPVFASEVEPFPIRVTTKRLPDVLHLGDINKIDGGKIPPVDIITGGSPCTDVSLAGARKGLHGERSGLFFEMARVIEEMREATNQKYPQFVVWENVPGAYSSNKGLDFLEVLNEFVHIKDETLHVPFPEKGKWEHAGEIVGDGFSLAWRTLDAQFWGCAQRRKRCYLVVDFAGERAGEILFVEQGMSGDFAQSKGARQDTTRTPEIGTQGTICLNDQGGSVMSISENISGTLRAQEHGHQPIVVENHPNDSRVYPINTQVALRNHKDGDGTGLGVGENGDPAYTLMAGHSHAVAVENHPNDSRVKICEDGIVQTLSSRMGTGGGNVPLVMSSKQYALSISENTANTLAASDYKEPQVVFEPKAYGISGFCSNAMLSGNPKAGIYEATTSRTLDTTGGTPACNQGGIAVVSIEGNGARPSHKGSGFSEDGVSFTLNTVERHGVCYPVENHQFGGYQHADIAGTLKASGGANGGGSETLLVESRYLVRRLTPTECALLQGFPPDWCANLETENPTEEDIVFWTDVWETHRLITDATKKPKTKNQIIKWLKNPHSDSAEYKLWGNGIALPCAAFVLGGIANTYRKEQL